MRFAVWPSPAQPFENVLECAKHAEATGWDGVWFADHFMPNAADNGGPTLEVWAVLAALAIAVPRVRIGSLVCGNTYRHPAVLAKQASAVDVISGGRLVLGIGAGWQENEHTAYGIPFHTVGERSRRLDEACRLITGLLSEKRSTFEGRYYRLTDAPLEPKPIQQPLPLLVGGGGEKVTMKIAARYAQEWNTWGNPAILRHKIGVLERHCESLARDPREIKRSANAMLMLDATPDQAAEARTSNRPVIAGSVRELQETIGEYQEAGVDELIIPDFNISDPAKRRDTYDRFIGEVAASFR
jgi:F420-dependent oxidoreductase-like protein